MKSSDQRTRQRVFAITGGKFSGYYRFKKAFYGLADIPTIFQEKIDRTLEYCTPAWLDDILVVTRRDKQNFERFFSRYDADTLVSGKSCDCSSRETEFQ